MDMTCTGIGGLRQKNEQLWARNGRTKGVEGEGESREGTVGNRETLWLSAKSRRQSLFMQTLIIK